MMKYLILLPLISGIFKVDEPRDQHEINKIITSCESEQCFDDLMYSWFIKFHEIQEKGYDMTEADEQAADHAITIFEICK